MMATKFATVVLVLSLSVPVSVQTASAAPGDIFMARFSTDEIVRFDPNTGSETIVAALTEAENLWSIAIGGNGDIFVTDVGEHPPPTPGLADGKIWRVTQSGTVTQVTSGGFLVFPVGIDVEPDGNLIVIDSNDRIGNGGFDVEGRVIRIDPTTGAQTLLAQGAPGDFLNPQGDIEDVSGVEVAANGDIYVLADQFRFQQTFPFDPGRVLNVDPATGDFTFVSQGGELHSQVSDMSLEANGTILAIGQSSPSADFSLVRIDPATGAQTAIFASFPGPSAVSVEPDGTILVGNTFPFEMIRIDPVTLATTTAPFPFDGDFEVQLPQCGDRIDNDGDGLLDMLDTGCANSNDNTEAPPLASPGWIIQDIPTPEPPNAGLAVVSGTVFVGVGLTCDEKVVRIDPDGTATDLAENLEFISSMTYDAVNDRLLIGNAGACSGPSETVFAIPNPFDAFPMPLDGSTLNLLPTNAVPSLFDITMDPSDGSGQTLLLSQNVLPSNQRIASLDLPTGLLTTLQNVVSGSAAGVDTAAGELIFGVFAQNQSSVQTVPLPPGTGTPTTLIGNRPGQFDLVVSSNGASVAMSELKFPGPSTLARVSLATGQLLGAPATGFQQITQIDESLGLIYTLDPVLNENGVFTLRPTKCNDGIDNDGDTFIDFPADPQCVSLDDDAEAGGGGPGCRRRC